MCLVIHKPAHAAVPDELLASAAEYNPHGFGLMALRRDGRLAVYRRSRSRYTELRRLYREHAAEECVIHLRYRTTGEIDLGNVHPLRVTKDIWLAHNGTLRLDRPREDRSDTWHAVADYLRPILKRRPGLLHERGFHELLASWAGPGNRFAFMDARERRTVIVNREAGVDVEDIWLSNTRWFDASRFPWRPAVAAAPRRLQFLL